MKGSETYLLPLMEGAQKYFIIPVYQRKYDWKIENCQQLYEDLKRMLQEGRPSHFFGSIVSAVEGNGGNIEYHVIDGQQRLTTVTLLLLAMRNLVAKGTLSSARRNLSQEIEQRFLISPWATEKDRIRLKPVKGDREAFNKLFGAEEDFVLTSNLTHNYQFFCDILQRQEIAVDELFNAISRLQVISITLESSDNAQLIFESLNSTGLALSEGDKIRNYILMGQSPRMQNYLYDNYWTKIESCTFHEVSSFVRDYLSIKQQVTPTVATVYRAFKGYATESRKEVESFLQDMLDYARLYEKLLTCKSGLNNQKLDDCLYRMKRLEIAVTRPFLMEVLRLNQSGKLSTDEVLRVFHMTENYLFRRNICEVPTNALNKVFLNLNREILRYDGTTDRYVEKMAYALLSKRDSGRFPDNEEFSAALSSKQVYLMRGKYKAYLFERFENYGTVELKDVFRSLDNNTYTIEHIMPQHLTPEWIRDLGPNHEKIHAEWQHRLANLTLSGYNPNLSNNTFVEKRDAIPGGYRDSGLRMNQRLATETCWGLMELQKRNDEMVERAIEIWTYPTTSFQPIQRQMESCTLDDEDLDLTGRDIQKYSYLGAEQPAGSWTEMFEKIICFLHRKDKSVLYGLADSSCTAELSQYVSDKPEELRSAFQMDEQLYVEKNTSTAAKLRILRRLFPLYQADAGDLTFFLRNVENDKVTQSTRFHTRLSYWTQALPIIQQQNLRWGIFNNVKPGTSNTISGHFGIRGFHLSCIANFDCAKVLFWLGSTDTNKNKEAFDRLQEHKTEIEQQLGCVLEWNRSDDSNAFSIGYSLLGVSIGQENDWPIMAKFHAYWSERICSTLLPYLEDLLTVSIHRMNTAGLLREWCLAHEEIQLHLDRSNFLYTRFTTKVMSEILPDLTNALSSWGTPNHYFYEITNRNGKEVAIQLSINSQNMSKELLAQCERINQFFPSRQKREDWQWRMPFKTHPISIYEPINRAMLFKCLDERLQEILIFEKDLKSKLSRDKFPHIS